MFLLLLILGRYLASLQREGGEGKGFDGAANSSAFSSRTL
jgi:hypothetical protein